MFGNFQYEIISKNKKFFKKARGPYLTKARDYWNFTAPSGIYKDKLRSDGVQLPHDPADTVAKVLQVTSA